MYNKLTLSLILIFFQLSAFSINPEPQIKEIQAIRVGSKPIIDGIIDEIYHSVPTKATDFTTFEPRPGLPSAYRTEVSVVYDDRAIYIAAKLYDDNPDKIIKDLSPRDRTTNTDFFGVTFDPFKTGLTGYTFIVTAAGVQVDAKTIGDEDDSSWNDVWKSAVKFDEDGYVIEMEIPYSALRFPTGNANDWNIQFTRSVRSSREKSFWNPVNPEIDGFLTQMGKLNDIENLETPLRLSVTPYVGLQLNSFPKNTGGIDLSPKINGGLDLKYGINEAFTLDMVLVPDFSQVRSDVQVLNLSAFEIQFDENRPFFTEGLELFSTANIFYTRRIGGQAFRRNEIRQKSDFQEFTSLPNNNLINATKVSGRTNGNVGVGFFNAIEAPTYAEYLTLSGETKRDLANPLTNYNVTVVEKALKNNSKFSLINTNVFRLGTSYDANVSGIEWNLRNNQQKYDLKGKYVLSQKYLKDETNLGYVLSVNTGKIQGAWTYRAGVYIESANYDINDLGFLRSGNEMNYNFRLNYNKYKPKNEKLASYRVSNNLTISSLYKPNVFTTLYTAHSIFVKLKTFTAFGFDLETTPLGFKDYFDPRTIDFSKFLYSDEAAEFSGFLSTDYRRPVALDLRFSLLKFNTTGRQSSSIRVAPRFRLNDKIFIVPSSKYDYSNRNIGYVFYSDIVGLNPTEDILIGTRNISTITNAVSAQYNITNVMSLNLELDHYFSTVKYQDFGVLNYEGRINKIAYTGIDDQGIAIHDRNFNFFTMNLVYTWRFAPGSDLILSFKSNVQQFTELASYFENVGQLSTFYETSTINLKALYFLDINRFRKI